MDRILTTHVGSLLRPTGMTATLKAAERGESYDAKQFERDVATGVTAVVDRQLQVGLDIVDDGEIAKVGFIAYLYDRLSGIEPRISRRERRFPTGLDPEAFAAAENLYVNYRVAEEEDEDGVGWVCAGAIRYDPSAVQRDIQRLRTALDGKQFVDAFIPAVAPGSIYWLVDEHYGSDEALVYAFADALHEEYALIVDAGFLVSIDDPVIWHKIPTNRLLGGSHDDYLRWAELRIEALNYALRGIPSERVRYHVCSGSGPGAHTQDAPLRDIIELILRVDAHAYLIEQGNARHEHEWRIWEEVPLPDDKIIVPGVVTHHTMMVEHPELVAQRIVRLARLVGRERVMASTDCGFAQEATTRRVPEWTQWAKLEALVKGAELASRELWPTPHVSARTA